MADAREPDGAGVRGRPNAPTVGRSLALGAAGGASVFALFAAVAVAVAKLIDIYDRIIERGDRG